MTTVLVVDDEVGLAELIEAILTDEGHHVLIAVNGKQGLEMAVREHPALLFLDCMMPVLDGAGMLRGMAESPSLEGVMYFHRGLIHIGGHDDCPQAVSL